MCTLVPSPFLNFGTANTAFKSSGYTARLGLLLFPLDTMPVRRRLPPRVRHFTLTIAATYIFSWLKRVVIVCHCRVMKEITLSEDKEPETEEGADEPIR